MSWGASLSACGKTSEQHGAGGASTTTGGAATFGGAAGAMEPAAGRGGASAGGGTSGGVSGAAGGWAHDAGSNSTGGAPEATAGGSANAGNAGSAENSAGNAAGGTTADGGTGGEGGAIDQSNCGDGKVTEACDDGNLIDGDGCSATCTVEPGFSCTNPKCDANREHCGVTMSASFRDFNASTEPLGHPDFSPPATNFRRSLPGLVEPLLNARGKPELVAASTEGFIQSKATFQEWYEDGGGRSAAISGSLVLWNDLAQGVVNRWGAAGEQWIGYGSSVQWCPNMGCTTCGVPPSDMVCLDRCAPLDVSISCFAQEIRYDGNPLFFPLDSADGVLTEARAVGEVPDAYGWTFRTDVEIAQRLGVTTPIVTAAGMFPSAEHNFNFTSEIKGWFRYDATRGLTIDVQGDDDVWLFVNGRLALDLGGMHVPLMGTFTLLDGNANSRTNEGAASLPASSFGISDGAPFEVALFHAERQQRGSTLMLRVTGPDVSRSVCGPVP
ncbi:MAG: fibro-slime domain-containing protein [Myxococcota bacterium]